MPRGADPREPFPLGYSVEAREPDQPSTDASSRRLERTPIAGPAHRRVRDPLSSEPRQIQEIHGQTFRVRESEVEAMVELGKFRAIAQEDLVEFFYAGDKDRFRSDTQNLIRRGLIQAKAIPHETTGSRTLLTLTELGHRFLTETRAGGKDQVLYYGFTKLREAHHDADLFRLCQNASEEIERQGGKNLRVVLDYEMKKRIYHDLAKLGEERNSLARKREIAERHQLQMVRGKIPVPDIRIEYETCEGERARIDLELATEHYRERSLAEKIRAGFAIYAHGDEAFKLRKLLDRRGLTAEILSL
jgi:hypothetical protein